MFKLKKKGWNTLFCVSGSLCLCSVWFEAPRPFPMLCILMAVSKDFGQVVSDAKLNMSHRHKPSHWCSKAKMSTYILVYSVQSLHYLDQKSLVIFERLKVVLSYLIIMVSHWQQAWRNFFTVWEKQSKLVLFSIFKVQCETQFHLYMRWANLMVLQNLPFHLKLLQVVLLRQMASAKWNQPGWLLCWVRMVVGGWVVDQAGQLLVSPCDPICMMLMRKRRRGSC